MTRGQIQKVIFLVNLIMGAVMTVTATMVLTPGGIQWGQGATWEGLLQTWIVAFFIGYGVGELIPAMDWATHLGVKLSGKPTSLVTYVLQCVILAIVMVTMIGIFLCLVKGGFAMWWFMISKIYFPLLGAAFVALLIVLKPILMLAMIGARPPVAPAAA
ncbi:MAG: hypothetical protein FWF25_02560 [Propionibacteriaceae bacterium]|nr:hypothetical protein [Propionibacteriaceae bacterium]